MGSRRSMDARTKASIAPAVSGRSWGSAVPETIGFERASSGKSHSYVTPRTSSPRPRAKAISVADGSNETIFMPRTRSTGERAELERALQDLAERPQGSSGLGAVHHAVVERERQDGGRPGIDAPIDDERLRLEH